MDGRCCHSLRPSGWLDFAGRVDTWLDRSCANAATLARLKTLPQPAGPRESLPTAMAL
jgi:hypothetical protein